MSPHVVVDSLLINIIPPAEMLITSHAEEVIIKDSPEETPNKSSKMSVMELYRTTASSKDTSKINDPEKFRQFFIILITSCMDLKEKQSKMEMDDISHMQEIKEALFKKLQESNIEIQNNFIVSFFGTVETIMTQIAIVLGFVSIAFGYQFAVLSAIATFISVSGRAAHLFFKSKEDLLKSQMVMQQQSHDLLKEGIKRHSKAVGLTIEDWKILAEAIVDEIYKFNQLAKAVCRNIK